MTRILHYLDATGQDLFNEWLLRLPDLRAQAKIETRIERVAVDNFGDCKALGQGLYELRVDWGPGYRICYAVIAQATVLLLCGGDKRKQSSDIRRALGCLRDYRARTKKQ